MRNRDICAVANPNFERLKERWFKSYRLILHEEQSYLERWQIIVTRWGVLWAVIGIEVVVIALTYGMIGWTPLKEVVIPGYASEDSRLRAIEAELSADSALRLLQIQEQYLVTLKAVLQGEVVDEFNPSDTSEQYIEEEGEVIPDWGLTPEDIDLRMRIEEEDRFAFQRAQSGNTSLRSIPFAPIQGVVSSDFDPVNGHYGVDFVAPVGSVIHAVDDGVVVIASYTSDGGYVVNIQHTGNRLSVYKHNKSLLVETGDRVQAGAPIAILGGTGTHSTGPHSHFEWWVEGQPLDPTHWLPDLGSGVFSSASSGASSGASSD